MDFPHTIMGVESVLGINELQMEQNGYVLPKIGLISRYSEPAEE